MLWSCILLHARCWEISTNLRSSRCSHSDYRYPTLSPIKFNVLTLWKLLAGFYAKRLNAQDKVSKYISEREISEFPAFRLAVPCAFR